MPEHTNTTTGTHRFEKNNYFYGKLLTVRDMAAEQAYHSGIQRTLSRYVTDWGVICGLNVTTTVETDDETGQESLAVTVSEGLALDRCGRLLSVSDPHHDSVSLPPEADGLATDTISVYIEYDECFTDPVPTAKMENACEEDCKDNRVIEEADVTVEAGDPGDYHKSVAEVEFPSTEELGLADDHQVQTLGLVGDILLRGEEGEGNTVSLDLSISDTAPSGTVNVDISPPQTGDPTTLAGSLEVPADAFIGLDGFVLPEGEFTLTGTVGEIDSRMAVGGNLTATETDNGVSFEGTILFQGVDDQFDIPIEFDFAVDGGDIDFESAITFPEVVFESEGDLSASDRDEEYLLTGSTEVFRVTDEGEELEGIIETTEWMDDSEDEIDGLLLDRPETREEPDDEEGIDLDEVLSGPARSYYENESRTECQEATEDRILVGTITSEGEDWNTTSFTYGPLVYTNDLLYDALVNHAADFDNPHGSIASINGVGPDENGDFGITSDDMISVTRGTHSINLSATGGGGEGLPDEFQDYIFEKSLWCECDSFRVLADRFDMDTPRDIAQILSHHLTAWRAGRSDYLDVFEGENALQEREQDLQRELQQDQWVFLGGVDHYSSAVNRLITLVNRDAAPIEIAIAQLRVCEAAACLSGDCLSFDRFPLPRESLRRPFTVGDYIIDSQSDLRLVETRDGMGIRIPQEPEEEPEPALIDLPTTSHARLEMRCDGWSDVEITIEAIDTDGDEHTVVDQDGDDEWQTIHQFMVAESDTTRIRISQQGDGIDLLKICHR